MPRLREKSCALCQQISSPLFRVQIDAAQDWQLICGNCHDRIASQYPDYRYGGTWKAKKRH